MLKQDNNRDCAIDQLFQSLVHLYERKRVPSQIEEIGIHTQLVDLKEIAPQFRDHLLHLAPRHDIGGCAAGRRLIAFRGGHWREHRAAPDFG